MIKKNKVFILYLEVYYHFIYALKGIRIFSYRQSYLGFQPVLNQLKDV